MTFLDDARALDRRIWLLGGARLVVTSGFSMVMPLLAFEMTRNRGFSAITIGLLWTVAGMTGAAFQWIAGEIADRIGRRPLLIGSLVLRAVNLGALGWAVGTRAPLAVLGALTVGNAVLRGLFDPVCSALVADIAPPSQRVAAFSLQRVGINLGWAAGVGLPALFWGVPYATLFYVSAPLCLLAAVSFATMPETLSAQPRHKPTLAELLSFRDDRPFVVFLAGTVALYLLQVQLYQTLSIYAARVLQFDERQVRHLYGLNGLMVVFLQLPAMDTIRRWGTRRALVLGATGYAVAYASCGLAVGHLSLLVVVAAITLSEIVSSPAQQTTAAGMAPAGRLGAYSGLYGLAQATGQSVGPLLGGLALESVPARLAWPLLALFGLAAARLYRRAGQGTTGARDVISAPHS